MTTTTTTPTTPVDVGNVSMSTNTTPIIKNHAETKNNNSSGNHNNSGNYNNSGNHNNNKSLLTTTNCSTTTASTKLHHSQHHHHHNESTGGGGDVPLITSLSSMSSSHHRKQQRQQQYQHNNYSRSNSNPVLTSGSYTSDHTHTASTFSNRIMFYTSFRVLLDEIYQSKIHLFNTRITWLLLFGPVAIIGSWTGSVNEDMLFLFAGIALIPCAERLSFVTEQVAEHTNSTIGALLNATFGNAPELLISVSALRSGFYRVVQLAMLGSMLTNLILVFGVACIIGGCRYQVQQIRQSSGNVSVVLLLLATAGSLFPAALVLSGQFPNPETMDGTTSSNSSIDVTTQRGQENYGYWARKNNLPSDEEVILCRVNAIVMIVLYFCYLIFQLGTHRDEFDEDASHYLEKKFAKRNKSCQQLGTFIVRIFSRPITGVRRKLLTRKTSQLVLSRDGGGQMIDEEYGSENNALLLDTDDESTILLPTKVKDSNEKKRSSRQSQSKSQSSIYRHKRKSDKEIANQGNTSYDIDCNSLTEHSDTVDFVSHKIFTGSQTYQDDCNLSDRSIETNHSTIHDQIPQTKSPIPGRRRSINDVFLTKNNGGNKANHNSISDRTSRILQASRSKSKGSDVALSTDEDDDQDDNYASCSKLDLLRSQLDNSNHERIIIDRHQLQSTSKASGIIYSPSPGGHRRRISGGDARRIEVLLCDPNDEDLALPVPIMSLRVGIIWLFIITSCISLMSDILVGTIDGFARRMHLSQVFTSMVIIPFFSNVAEQVSAFIFAYHNKMDLCVGVTVGSAIQIATFVLPGSVIIGMILDRNMTLYFHTYETVCLFFGVIVVAAILQGGTTNWLVGVMLVGIYVMFAAGIWFHEHEDLSIDIDQDVR